jgi:pimeloyl-ACP methyl ester carboxylesterase
MQAVIDDLRARYPGLPVWVVGTSRGSTAAAQAGAAVVPSPSGVVLTSPVTVTTTPSVFDVSLDAITAPVLIAAHKEDACPVTPPSDAAALAAALTAARRVSTRQFQGGFPALDPDPCNALTPHGFIGLEPKVMEKITKWIEQQD